MGGFKYLCNRSILISLLNLKCLVNKSNATGGKSWETHSEVREKGRASSGKAVEKN